MAEAKKQTGKTPAPYHRGNVAEDLLAAAARMLETERFEDISARRLCREIGVTSANFYNHFPSFNHLMHDLAAQGFERRAVQNLRVLKQGLSREEALIQVTHTMVEFTIEHNQLFRIMYGQLPAITGHTQRNDKANESFAVLVRVIYGADIFRPDDPAWSHEHCLYAYSFFSFTYGLARLVSMEQFEFPSGTKAERRKFVEDAARAFISGLPPLARDGARARPRHRRDRSLSAWKRRDPPSSAAKGKHHTYVAEWRGEAVSPRPRDS